MTEPQIDTRRRFAMIPEDMLFDPEIPAEAVRVFGVLHRYGSTPDTCFPSLSRIGKHVGASPRSVRRWLGILEAKGWLRRIARQTTRGDADSNAYQLFPQQNGTDTGVRTYGQDSPHPRTDESVPTDTNGRTPGQESPEGTDTGVRLKRASEREPLNESAQRSARRSASAHADPLFDPGQIATVIDISTREGRASGPTFDDFWAVWPQKRDKKRAKTAWDKAVAAGTDPSLIIDGARRFLADPELDKGFTPYGASFINGERWEDEHLVPKQDDRQQQATGRRASGHDVVAPNNNGPW